MILENGAFLLILTARKVGDKLFPVLDAVFQPVTYLWTILLRKLSDTGPGTLLLWGTTSLYQQNQHEPVKKKILGPGRLNHIDPNAPYFR